MFDVIEKFYGLTVSFMGVDVHNDFLRPYFETLIAHLPSIAERSKSQKSHCTLRVIILTKKKDIDESRKRGSAIHNNLQHLSLNLKH